MQNTEYVGKDREKYTPKMNNRFEVVIPWERQNRETCNNTKNENQVEKPESVRTTVSVFI